MDEATPDPYIKRVIKFGASVRHMFRRADDAELVKKAVVTAGKYVSNISSNPTDDKFRAIKMSNGAFQRLIGGHTGGVEMMKEVGFVEVEEEGEKKLKMDEPLDQEWLKRALAEIETIKLKGVFY